MSLKRLAPASRRELLPWRGRLLLCSALSAAALLACFLPGAGFPYRLWAALALMTPVATWGAWPLCRDTAHRLKRRQAAPDGLSVLTLAASFLSALYALVATAAGRAARPPAPWRLRPGNDSSVFVYLLAAVAVITVATLARHDIESRLGVQPRPAGTITADSPTPPDSSDLADPAASNPVDAAASGFAAADQADRIAAPLAAAAISVAAVAFTGWFIAGGPVSAAWSAAVAVLIVACPAALTLAAPLAYAVGWRRAAPLGLRVSSPATLALAGRVDTVVLDRSGALTTGHLDLTGVYPLEGLDEAALLRVGGALASQASTPLARAVTQAALARGLVLPRATEVVSIRNRGVSATVEDHQAYVGRLPWAAAQTTQPITPALAECYADAVARGRTAIAFVWDGRFQGIVEIGNPLRPTSAAAVAAFRRLGLDLMIVTRADQATARYTAELLGVSEFAAELTDTCKADIVRKRQAAGRIVAMVSDGVDSAPALAQADLAITLANPAAAASGAGLALLRDDLLAAADAIRLARRTAVCARGNLTWAVACHIAILPAAFGLVSPVLAAAVAALTVAGTIVNSLRLRAFRASGHPKAPQTATA